MNSRERVLAALNLKEPDVVPFMDYFDAGIKKKLMIEKTGRDDLDEAEFAKAIGMDAIYFSEYCAPMFRKSSGGERALDNVAEGGTTFAEEGMIRTNDDLKYMVLPDPHDESFYDPAKRFIEKYHNSGLAIYPATRALGMQNVIYSMPMMDFAIALHENLSLINNMMDIYCEWHMVVLDKLQKIGGIDFMVTYNDMAFKSGPLVSPQVLNEVFMPKMKKVADAIKVPWAYHSDGDLSTVIDDLLPLGFNALNPIEPPCMDMKEVKEKWGDKVCLWGNIDLIETLTRGTVEQTEEEVKQRIMDAGKGGGYICATANSVTDFCKVENVLAMTNAVKKYGKYPLI